MKNRVIKFRIWNNLEKRFVINSDLRLLCNFDTFEMMELLGHQIKQFTGLLDKNNKEIYEGDILFCTAEQMMKNNTPIIYKSNYYGLVEYNAPSFVLRDIAKMSPIFWDGCEIVGNFFENPELL